MSPKLSPPSIGDVMADKDNAIDSRYHLSAATSHQLNKVLKNK
jgi:ubiquinol-cytochrome c reductase cytochrome b subunit